MRGAQRDARHGLLGLFGANAAIDVALVFVLECVEARQHEFARGLQGYPTFVLYKADGTVLQAIPGFYSAKDFAVILWYFASGDCDKYPFERYQKIFDKEIRPAME